MGDLLFIRQRNPIHQQHLRRQQQPRRSSIQQRRAQEAHRAPVVHRRARDIERKAGDWLIHQDAEVIAEVGAGDAKSVGGGQDEDVAEEDKEIGERWDERLGEGGGRGLGAEGAFESVGGVREKLEGEREGRADKKSRKRPREKIATARV